MAVNPHAELRGVTKKFGGAVALNSVDVNIEAGAIHALVGENGAGKSTLGKIITGVHTPDSGQLLVNGSQVAFKTPRDALALGITLVAQELSLVPQLSAAENIFLGIEHLRGPVIDHAATRTRFDELVEEYGIEVPPDQVVSRLSVADQQKVEILRSLARDASLIVMDEPTARLSSSEAHNLRTTVRKLSGKGVTVIYISHFLDEVLAISDRVTIMRDGTVVRTTPTDTESRSSLIEGIVGRSLETVFPPRQAPELAAPAVLSVRGLERTGAFEDVSFEIRAGEIVTLAGLVGSGRTELVRVLFGADPPTGGSIDLNGLPYQPRSPRQAIRAGVAMVPESRSTQGLLPLLPVRINITLAHLSKFVAPGGVVRANQESSAAERISQAVGLTGATIETRTAQLSGGNQQKALFGRWLVSRPRLFIADEPTRGVDVGAKRGIYNLLVELASQGIAILLVSSELEEVLGLAHRIIVMSGGRIVGELAGEQASEKDVMTLAFGASAA
ncbi:MAG: sugar ABC transporter ATP-binding protein [Acidimicrobiia bacterium]|nr:sugar ABC transporter ATP-binding protein [Acidimicrobiia bacterium]